MRGLLRFLLPRRRRGWIWVALTAGIVVNGLRLRDRLARIPVLPDDAPADGPPLAYVTAAGVILDHATKRAVAAHAASEGLRAVDIVPADLPFEQALDLAREVDTETYRAARLTLGRGALHAIAVEPALVERLALPRTEGLDPVEMAQASIRAKQCAPTATDLVVAPHEHGFALRVDQRLPYLRALAGSFSPVVATMPAVQHGLMAAGVLLSPGWGIASLVASAAQPWLATGGTGLTPGDLTAAGGLGRLARRPANAIRSLRTSWQPAIEVAADPRMFARKVPEYAALLAGGTEPFFEDRRPTCPLCGCGDLRARLVMGDLLQHKPGRFRLDECPGCGHLFQNPRLSLEGLDFYYRDFYDGLSADEAEFLFAATDAAYRARARMVAAVVPEPARWLDVGGGHGHFCLIAAEELPGTTFDGLDMSDSIDDAARRGWIANGYRGLLPDVAPRLTGAYDVVSLHHELEHTRDPLAELAAARTVLVPGGHLLIELPDPECLFARAFGQYWGPWFQPQHQHFFSVRNLRHHLGEAGFTVVEEVRGDALQPADLAYFLWLLANRIAPPPRKPWLPEPTTAHRLQRAATFAAFGPGFIAAILADKAAAPLLRKIPGGSNAFRILARADDRG